jgi:transcriptional regulator with XRE-family HTH domain
MNKYDLKNLRNKRNLSQTELGQLIGVNQKRIAKIETNPDSVSFGQIKNVLKTMGAKLEIKENEEWENPIKSEISFVYVLHHRSLPILKIGKANDIGTRANQLAEFDRYKSFSIKTTLKGVFRIEKILHRTFSKWSLPNLEIVKMGIISDGSTEWFSSDCLERIEKFVTANKDLLGCEIESMQHSCPKCGSQPKEVFGLGNAIYSCNCTSQMFPIAHIQ